MPQGVRPHAAQATPGADGPAPPPSRTSGVSLSSPPSASRDFAVVDPDAAAWVSKANVLGGSREQPPPASECRVLTPRRSSINVEVVAAHRESDKENQKINVADADDLNIKTPRKTLDQVASSATMAERVRMESLEQQLRASEAALQRKDTDLAQQSKRLEEITTLLASGGAASSERRIQDLEQELLQSRRTQGDLETQLDKRALEADAQQKQFVSDAEVLTARLREADASQEAAVAELEAMRMTACQDQLAAESDHEENAEALKRRCEKAEREAARLREALRRNKRAMCELESDTRQDRALHLPTPGEFCRMAKLQESEGSLSKHNAALALENATLLDSLERCKQALRAHVPAPSRFAVTRDLQGIQLVWEPDR